MREENNRQWVWLSDKYSHLPLPENQFIMSLQNSRAERNRQAAVMMRHKSRLTKLTDPNSKWLWSESQKCSLSAWTVPTVIGEVSVGSSSNLYQSFWERDKTHILIGMYLKCGTFHGRLFSNWLLCPSGLLKGRVPWSVDGGDDLQLGWLQTLLQWLGGELIDQLAATWAISENASYTQLTQILMLLFFVFARWIVLNVLQHSYSCVFTDCSLNSVDVNVNVHILPCFSLLWSFDAIICERKHCIHAVYIEVRGSSGVVRSWSWATLSKHPPCPSHFKIQTVIKKKKDSEIVN